MLVCGLIVAIGVSATALASALGGGAKPAPKPLAEAVHDALGAGQVQGVSANITLTNHLLEGANLASGGDTGGGGGGSVGELASSPLIKGASGRLWIAKDGHVRLELQSEKGDTQIYYDGHTVTMYDAATNKLYRYTPSTEETGAPAAKSSEKATGTSAADHEVPSVAKIEEAIAHLQQHANVSGATPTNVAGQPAYTVRVTPKETGSMLGGAELSFDSVHGTPLRAAIYSTSSSSPVIELAATELTYGPVDSSVFSFTPPKGATVEELTVPSKKSTGAKADTSTGTKPTVKNLGHGISSVGVLESKSKTSAKSTSALEGLPKVSINGVSASELRTALGTILTFERSGVRYVLAGSVTPASIEALARGL